VQKSLTENTLKQIYKNLKQKKLSTLHRDQATKTNNKKQAH